MECGSYVCSYTEKSIAELELELRFFISISSCPPRHHCLDHLDIFCLLSRQATEVSRELRL